MNNVVVPKPDHIFGSMSQTDIEEFGENTDEYIIIVESDNVLVLRVLPEFLLSYEIYCTFDQIPNNVMSDLSNYGYKIIYSDKKLSGKFVQLSEAMRPFFINSLFNKEFTYYAYL